VPFAKGGEEGREKQQPMMNDEKGRENKHWSPDQVEGKTKGLNARSEPGNDWDIGKKNPLVNSLRNGGKRGKDGEPCAVEKRKKVDIIAIL